MRKREEAGIHEEEEIPPIPELDDFELPLDTDFADRVRRSIDFRQVASGIIELSIHDFSRLLVGYLSTLLGIFHTSSDSDTDHKEP